MPELQSEAQQAPMMAAPLPWVILRRVLLRKDDTKAEHPAAICTALRAPPRVTLLAVPPEVYPGRRIRSDEHPYLVATGPSALLLCFFDDLVPIVTDELILARQFVAPVDAKRQPTTGSIDRVPRRTGPSMPATYDIMNVGLIPGVFGGYVIAELQVTKRSNRAKLFRLISGHERWSEADRLFSGVTRQWFETELDYPLSTIERDWSPNGVLAHANKLWWFDLSWGLLSCNPNDLLHPVLSFHDLPPGCYLSLAMPYLETIRCIRVSENMLRYVGTARDHDPDGLLRETEKKVVIWTWIPADANEGKWHKSYETDFKDIWNDVNYRATGLPALVPEIVLVSPRNHNVVYFFLNKTFFGVDVPSHRVVHIVEDCNKLATFSYRHCVLPWDLPSSIVNGLVEDIDPIPEQGGSPSTSQGATLT